MHVPSVLVLELLTLPVTLPGLWLAIRLVAASRVEIRGWVIGLKATWCLELAGSPPTSPVALLVAVFSTTEPLHDPSTPWLLRFGTLGVLDRTVVGLGNIGPPPVQCLPKWWVTACATLMRGRPLPLTGMIPVP